MAEPVLVATYTTTGLAAMLPSPTLFDHAIVRVTLNGKRYFLDPTRLGQYGALDRMGQAHGARQVLVVKADVTALETIPLQSREFMTSKRFERALVTDFAKPAEFQTRVEMAGVSAESMRARVGSPRRRGSSRRLAGRRESWRISDASDPLGGN